MTDLPASNSRAAKPSGLTVRCPNCAGPSAYHADNPYRPFCSARCKHIDLGAWSSEQFRVEAHPDPASDDLAN